MRSKTPLSLTLPPPAASGTTSDDHPSSAPRRHRSDSYPAALSARARRAVDGHSASRNLRVVSARSSWSGLRSNTGGNPQDWPSAGPVSADRELHQLIPPTKIKKLGSVEHWAAATRGGRHRGWLRRPARGAPGSRHRVNIRASERARQQGRPRGTRNGRESMEPSELMIREACRDAIAQYTHTGDRYMLEALAGAFCEDGTLETRGDPPVIGRQAIIERLSGGRGTTDAEIRA